MVLPRFELAQFLAAIEKHRINALYVAPPIVLALAKHPDVDKYDLSSLRVRAQRGGPAGRRTCRGLRVAGLGLPPVTQAYGMTELSPGTHVVPRHTTSAPPGTVGKLLPSTRDARRQPWTTRTATSATGERGELLFRGPQVMKGYLGRTGETDAMIDADGWLRTGDIGRVDEDGWLYVVDRVKELIKYKGYQVAPAELEAATADPSRRRGRRGHRRDGRGGQRGAQGVRGAAVERGGGGTDRGGGAGVRRRAGRPVQEDPASWSSSRACPAPPVGKILRRELRRRSPPERRESVRATMTRPGS